MGQTCHLFHLGPRVGLHSSRGDQNAGRGASIKKRPTQRVKTDIVSIFVVQSSLLRAKKSRLFEPNFRLENYFCVAQRPFQTQKMIGPEAGPKQSAHTRTFFGPSSWAGLPLISSRFK